MWPAVLVLLATSAPAPQLWVPGVLPAWEAPAKGTSAVALCGDHLREVILQVEPGPTPATRRVDAPCNAIALFAGIPQLTPGAVPMARIHRSTRLHSSPYGPARIDLRLGGRHYRIDRVRLGSTGYRLVLRGRGDQAVLNQAVLYEAQSTDRAAWDVVWAGDLDGDGMLDLLLDASDAESLPELRLFLSKGADELVDEVALLQLPVATP